MEIINQILEYRLFEGTSYEFRVARLLGAFAILFIARILIWLITKRILPSYYRRKSIDIGGQFAFNQILKYVIYVVAILTAIQSLGLNLTVLLGGFAALAVGIGLGLQQTFNDFASGLILLFERSIEVGDVVEVDGHIGKVLKIGMRTCEVETRDNKSIIVPNSKLVTESAHNWDHRSKEMRFFVPLGVEYGTDPEVVKKMLLEIAEAHPKVMENPPPAVRFVNFNNFSLDFELWFWSLELMGIEDVKSDLNFAIEKAIKKYGIGIPFPRTDMHIFQDGEINLGDG
ncbi:MAG: mechanosensitive ion channel domain-containing protein [Bacteroidota bacterium]